MMMRKSTLRKISLLCPTFFWVKPKRDQIHQKSLKSSQMLRINSKGSLLLQDKLLRDWLKRDWRKSQESNFLPQIFHWFNKIKTNRMLHHLKVTLSWTKAQSNMFSRKIFHKIFQKNIQKNLLMTMQKMLK